MGVYVKYVETYRDVEIYWDSANEWYFFTYDTTEYANYPTVELCHIQIDALVSGEVAPPATWPWPFDMIQGWFEALWDWISSAAQSAGSWLWDLIKPAFDTVSTWITDNVSWLWRSIGSALNTISTGITNSLTWLWDSINFAFDWIQDVISGAFIATRDAVLAAVAGAGKAVGDFSKWLYDSVSQAFAWLSGVIWGWVDGALRWLTDSFKWLAGEIGEAASWIASSVTTAFDGAVAAIEGEISGALIGLGSAFGEAFQGFVSWLVDSVNWIVTGLVNGIVTLGDFLRSGFEAISSFLMAPVVEALIPGSPPKGIEGIAQAYVKTLQDRILKELEKVKGSPVEPELAIAAGFGILAAMTTASVVGHTLGMAFDATHPIKNWGAQEMITHIEYNLLSSSFGSPILQLPVVIGVLTPMRYAYNKMFTPEIPGSGDLVRMVVREAFDPKMVIKGPPEFADAMKFQGFSEVWSDRYWTAHFEPIALRQAYENLWRGLWKKEQFMYALHIADIHPMWREDIYNVAFGPPSARELGYGFDVGIYSVEDIIKYRRWAGLSPEDAEKAGIAMVAYRTETERNALRTEAMNDFVAGLDTEEELRANLEALGGRPEVIELWVERAKFRTMRDLILDLKKTSVDQYVKGWITEQQLDQDLIELDFTAERRAVIEEEARTRRLKYKREAETSAKKLMSLAKIEKARELGLISDPEYVRRVMGTGITSEDAELMLAIELTPRPVSPEEFERRRVTVLSRRRRAERRYERSLARLQDQIDLTAGQLDDTRVTMEESLDVIDAQIAIIDADLPVVTPERAATLAARRVVLVQRRELQVARYEARIRKLTEQHKNLLETKDLLTSQRDEELSEYDAELKLLEVAG